MFTRTVWLTPTFLLSFLSAQVSNVDFPTQVNPIFQVGAAGCAAVGCHASGAGGMTLGSDATSNYNAMVNVASGCGTLKRIEPGDPGASQLYKKIEGSQTCGVRMPANNTNYFIDHADQLEIIRVWIVEGALPESTMVVAIGDGGQPLPEHFALEQNYPNPFNPSTQIRYDLPRAVQVTLTVYDLLGRQVVTLVDELQAAGSYAVRWNGRDRQGKRVGTGVYVYRMQAGPQGALKKMVYLK